MPIDFFKISKGNLEDFLKDNPGLQDILLSTSFYSEFALPEKEEYNAISYLAYSIPSNVLAIINYKQTRTKKIPKRILKRSPELSENSVYIRIKGDLIFREQDKDKPEKKH
ncbi:MAG TPA: hypothetical protein PLK34_00035 [Candidatus Pacearchaeota archaeon]|nr:hypothetical protein [Candidatus Pacearchaeota archaeon]